MERNTSGSTEESSDRQADEAGGLSRRGVLQGSAALGAAPILASAAGAADAAIGDGPQGIHVAYGADPTSTMTVAFTGAPGGGTVRYGEPGDLDTTAAASGKPVPGRDAMAYAVTLTGLAADTEYAYEVVLNGTTSDRYRFRTAPATDPGETDGFTITQVGDHGVADPDNPGQRPSSDDPELVMALAEAQDPAMQLLAGDISYSNGKPSTWELYFDTHQEFYAETPFMTVPGNHEAEVGTGLVQYDRRLNAAMPVDDPEIDATSKRRWWDVVYENAFVMGLNTTADACGDLARAEEFVPLYDPRCRTEQGLTYGEVQEQYMREALERAEARDDVQWKIVFFHGPLWTTAPDHEPRRDLQERWGPILDEYDVDLVLHGDNHVYERSKPITHTEDVLEYSRRREPPGRTGGEEPPPPEEAAEGLDLPFAEGTTFVVNGTGGVSHYRLGPREVYVDRATDEFFGITRLDVDDERIRVRYVAHPPLAETYDGDGTLPEEFDASLANPNVSVLDEFEIRKNADGRPVQVDDAAPTDPGPSSLSVEGTREDSGQVHTAGEVSHVSLEVTAASEPVEVRDRVPAEWDVFEGTVDRTEPGPDGTVYVYLDAEPGETVETDYFVRAPADVDDTGRYTFGPFEARGTDRFADDGWRPVTGTSSTENVVGFGTGLPL